MSSTLPFSDLVNSPPLADAIDDVLGDQTLRATTPVGVDSAGAELAAHRWAVHYLASWWLWDRTSGRPELDPRTGIIQISEGGGEAPSQADALLSYRAELRSEPDQFDRDAVELAIDYGRFEHVYETSEPPYDVPDQYGQYDEDAVEELLAITDRFETGLADVSGPLTTNDVFGITDSLDVHAPTPNLVLDSTAIVAVLGDSEQVSRDRLRFLVGIALLDDFIERIQFRWSPDEATLSEIDGVEYTDPAEQNISGLLGFAKAVTQVIADVMTNEAQLGMDSVSHNQLTDIGVYFANRGELRTLSISDLRASPGYDDLQALFAERFVAAADHEGLSRIAAHHYDAVAPVEA